MTGVQTCALPIYGVLEVQGDHALRVIELLEAEGFGSVKRAGG